MKFPFFFFLRIVSPRINLLFESIPKYVLKSVLTVILEILHHIFVFFILLLELYILLLKLKKVKWNEIMMKFRVK